MLLDRYLPRWHFRERHAATVHAPPDKTLEVLKRITPADVPLAGHLMRIRSLPALLTRRSPFSLHRDIPFITQITKRGFLLLEEEPGSELVLGTVGRFWTPSGEFCTTVTTRDEFLAFEDPRWVKVGWNFSADASVSGCTLCTETRILATSPDARVFFQMYWIFVRPWSGLIRRALLNAVKKGVETKREV